MLTFRSEDGPEEVLESLHGEADIGMLDDLLVGGGVELGPVRSALQLVRPEMGH
jgi:hypothetical protein